MNVHRAVNGHFQQLFRKNLSEGRSNHHVGLQCPHGIQPLLAAHSFKLIHRHAPFQGPLFHRAGRQLMAPARGPIRLGKGAHHFVSRVQQRVQRGHGEFRSAHKNHPGHSSSSVSYWSVTSSIILSM